MWRSWVWASQRQLFFWIDIASVLITSMSWERFFCATKTIMGATGLLHEYTYLLWINEDYEYQKDEFNVVSSVDRRAVTWRSWVWVSQRQLFFCWIDIVVCSLQFEVHSASSVQSAVSSLLDYILPTSPTALRCSTSPYQASPTIDNIVPTLWPHNALHSPSLINYTSGSHTPGSRFYSDLLDTSHQLILKCPQIARLLV